MPVYSGTGYGGVNLSCGRGQIDYVDSKPKLKGLRVQCLDCSHKWATESDNPKCPKCLSRDIVEDGDN
jgi:hypothetical protein